MSPQDGSAFLAFHEDELRAQSLAGQGASRAAIRPFMPEQHRAFFALLPYLFAATLDERPLYALEGSVFVAGAAVQWLRDGLKLFDTADAVEKVMMAAAQEAGG